MKITLTLFLFLFLTTNLKAQEFIEVDSSLLICNYIYTFRQDSTNINSTRSQEMVLQIGLHSSKFLSANSLYLDSLLVENKNEPVDKVTAKLLPMVTGAGIHSFCNYKIYKNYPESGIITTTGFINYKHLKVTEKTSFKWEIINNRDSIISGFKCIMAQTYYAGRNYIAWFTPKIPISEGPYKFCELPGLIIDIADNFNQHHFSLTGINKTNAKAIIYTKNNFIDVTPIDFVKAIHSFTSSMYNMIQQGTGIVADNDESKARALENIKSRNNYIEKY